jgi:hypothetical protein
VVFALYILAVYIDVFYITPPRTRKISGLKSQVLKTTFSAKKSAQKG